MPLRIKRSYEPAAATDGKRVLVDRVWPRGMTKEAAALDAWRKDIAPSAALREWFGHDPARWREFARRYREELDGSADETGWLEALARTGTVTLLYGARDTEHNQAVVLAGYIRERLRT